MSALPAACEAAAADAAVFPRLDAAAYVPHRLHASDRIWPETNCSVDLWIEVIASLGLPPEAAMGFTVTQDFEGDQFTFFKIPTDDLEGLYGIRLLELAIFDAPEAHVAEQVARGRLPLVELDSWWMPDTRGVAYRTEHGKTTVGVNRIDLAARRMEYFHNGGYFALDGEDFEGIWRTAARSADEPFLPYTEFAKFGPLPGGNLRVRAAESLSRHMARRPALNPVRAFQSRFADQAAGLYDRPAFFHKYAFNTLRQLGANFELLGSMLDWLEEGGFGEAEGAPAIARSIADTAKVVQFQLARAVARRKAEALPAQVEPAADAWDALMERLDRRFG
jgi:hypothetical protein